jgi:SulP family sulfate permease
LAQNKAQRPPTLSEVLPDLAARYVPISQWLPGYPKAWLRPDLTAAVTSWGVMVPVALAYAGLAGVPPELGLVTAFAAMAAYAVFGTSRHLKVTVSSTMAVMSASVVVDLAGGDPAAYLAYTAALSLTVGVMLLAAGLARLGFIADFLTKSVVTGFIIGVAITIIVGQLPKILGVPGLDGSLPEQLVQLFSRLPDTNPCTLAVGLSSLLLLLVLRRISPRIPGPLIVLILGILAVSLLDLATYGVSVVGEVATGMPLPSIPTISLSAIPYLVLGAAGIVFLAVGESVGGGRAYAAQRGYQIDPDQEMVALGAANLTSGLFGGFPADASLSQTATAETAGAKSQLSSLITAGLILATAVLLAPLFQNLPNAVLGAIVIAATLGLINIDEMRRYWRWRRTDFVIAMTAMVGVLLTTVLTGMIVAVMLSVLLLLYRASRPYVAVLGRMPGRAATFGDLARHPDAEPVPRLVIVRLDAPLYFFNANVAKGEILDIVAAQEPPPHGVLIDLAATADLDVTTTDMLFELVGDLRSRSIEVLVSGTACGRRA